MRTDGNRYYRVDVEITTESNNGKSKKHTEQFLTLASGVTEAETAVTKNFMEVNDMRDFRIKSVTQTKIVEVVG